MKMSIVLRHCVIIFVQLLICKTMAYKKTSNVNEYMVENQRTQKRHNYILQRDMLDNNEDIGPSYAMSPSFEPDPTNTEELPALIVDYANLIRNDIILMDNSVETRTRKRANQANPPHNCSCELYKQTIYLDRHEYFPPELETKKCSEEMCSDRRCKPIEYQVTVVRKRRPKESPQERILNTRLVSETRKVTVACLCINNQK